MLTTGDLHNYQRQAIQHILRNPRSMIWLPMGSGKTAIMLITIQHLLRYTGVSKVLIVGPLRVVQSVWETEARKWEPTRHLRFALIHGNPNQRMSALFSRADVYLINYEGLEWLSAQVQAYFLSNGTPAPFQMLVADEVSKLKNAGTVRHSALEPLLPSMPWRVGLTGTPAANGYLDLHGQYLAIDDGARLGVTKKQYESAYFKQTGYQGRGYEIIEKNKKIIHRAIHDITFELSQDEVCKLPDFITNIIHVDLPPKARKQYEKMEKLFFAELDDGEEVEVTSEVAKINKLLQMSNGAVYTDTETKQWSKVHDAKLDALEDILEEAAGSPVLLAYNFRTDAARICKKFPLAVDLSPLSGPEFNKAIRDFQLGLIPLLIGHPASMGHGVDGLQKTCSTLVWFGANWSLELTQQFNSRVHRQGREDMPVICHLLLGRNTMDEAVHERLQDKDQSQQGLRKAIAQYRDHKMFAK